MLLCYETGMDTIASGEMHLSIISGQGQSLSGCTENSHVRYVLLPSEKFLILCPVDDKCNGKCSGKTKLSECSMTKQKETWWKKNCHRKFVFPTVLHFSGLKLEKQKNNKVMVLTLTVVGGFFFQCIHYIFMKLISMKYFMNSWVLIAFTVLIIELIVMFNSYLLKCFLNFSNTPLDSWDVVSETLHVWFSIVLQALKKIEIRNFKKVSSKNCIDNTNWCIHVHPIPFTLQCIFLIFKIQYSKKLVRYTLSKTAIRIKQWHKLLYW